MSIKYGMLGLLEEQPAHGYKLRQQFERRVGQVWGLNIGQVYQTLKSLDRDGLVACFEEECDTGAEQGTPRRKYELTDKGRRFLGRWLTRAPCSPTPLRDELLVRLLLLAPEEPEEALNRIEAQAKVYRRHLAKLRVRERKLAEQTDSHLFGAVLGVDAAVLHAEAHLKWLENCRLRILDAAGDGGQTPHDGE